MDENNYYRDDTSRPEESSSHYRYVGAPSNAYDRDYRRSEPSYSGYTSRSPELPRRKRKKGMSAGGVVALALLCSLVGGCVGAGGMMWYGRSANSYQMSAQPVAAQTLMLQGERESTTVETASVNTGKLLSTSEVYANNVNSTVGIQVGITTNYWGYQTTSAASGSGFILTSDGYILTNYHVIEDGSSVTVTTYDDKTYDATVVGFDSKNDIAVLKVDAEGLTPVVLGNSDELQVGETVVAIGNPLGELTFSLTQGVVSALDRQITLSSGSTMTLIQTDTSINSGNSGGPLFNLYGEVIGITNAKYSSNSVSEASIDNIGFAIPINRVRSIVESIIENGYIVKPYIGLSAASVTSDLQSYGIPQGAAVKVIEEGGAAEKSGLQLNDVITQVNGQDITTSGELVEIVSRCSPGDTLQLTVYRQGEPELLTVTLIVGEKMQDALEQANTDAQQQQQQQQSQSQGGYSYGYGFPFGSFGGWG